MVAIPFANGEHMPRFRSTWSKLHRKTVTCAKEGEGGEATQHLFLPCSEEGERLLKRLETTANF